VNQYMKTKVPGSIRDIRFKNVSLTGQPGDYRVQLAGADAGHQVRQVTFDGVSILGTNLAPQSRALAIGPFVQDTRFPPALPK